MAGTGLVKLGPAARLQSSQNHQPEFNISNGYTKKRTVESCKVEETRRDGEERRKILFFSLRLRFSRLLIAAASLPRAHRELDPTCATKDTKEKRLVAVQVIVSLPSTKYC